MMPFMLEENEDGVLWYYGNIAGFSDGNRVIIDAIFNKEDLKNFIRKKTDKPIEVREGVYESICNGDLNFGNETSVKKMTLRIYQLLPDSPFEMRFISLHKREEKEFGHPKRSEYGVVYEGEINKFDLEDIWERFARIAPKDLGGHALSISDVVELTDGEDSRFFYIEPEVFTEIDFA